MIIKRIPNKLAKTLKDKTIVINPEIVKYNKEILRYDLGFDATLAKKYGSFLMPFEFIWEETKILTSGKSYESWIRELLREKK